jgi:hypothetical protein
MNKIDERIDDGKQEQDFFFVIWMRCFWRGETTGEDSKGVDGKPEIEKMRQNYWNWKKWRTENKSICFPSISHVLKEHRRIANKFTQEILHELKISTAQGAASWKQAWTTSTRSPEGWTGLRKKHCNATESDARVKQICFPFISDVLKEHTGK